MGLKDKASKINFAGLGGTVPSATADSKTAKTAPGELMAFANQQRSQLLQENEELKAKAAQVDSLQRSLDEAVADLAQWDGAKATRLLDPNCVVRSRWANRHELNFSGEDFEHLRDEIRSSGGNIQPIKVRPIGDQKFEVVFGHRRHEACRLEGLPVLAMIDNLDDKSMFVEMDRENRARKNLSAYEQGVMYRNALQEKLFTSQKALAESTGADASLVTKALYLANLPDEVVEAFTSILDIQFRFAKPLHDAVERNKTAVIAEAKKIIKTESRPDPKTVFEALISASEEKMEPFHFPEPVQFELNGKGVGQLTIGPKGVSLVLKKDVLTPVETAKLRDFVDGILKKK